MLLLFKAVSRFSSIFSFNLYHILYACKAKTIGLPVKFYISAGQTLYIKGFHIFTDFIGLSSQPYRLRSDFIAEYAVVLYEQQCRLKFLNKLLQLHP